MADYSFKDISTAGNRATWATYVYCVAQVTLSLAHMYQNRVISRYIDGQAGDLALTQSDSIVTVVSLGFLVVIITALIINARFLYLASCNAFAVRNDPSMIKPGWSIGWYVVPFANLWMPYRALKQTWVRLVSTDDSTPGWFIIWWLSWVVMNIFDRILSRVPVPDNLPDYYDYNVGYIISGFLWLIPAYFFLKIIGALRDAQNNPAEVFA